MNKIDRQAIVELIESEQTTNLSIVTYISAIAMSKYDKETEYPCIENFTVYKLYKNMKDKMHYINKSSVEKAFKRLIELNFFDFIDDKLVILNSGSGHIKSDKYYKSKGYITLHHFFFNKVFFNLSLRAKKLALYFVSRLNNSVTKKEKVNFKSMKNTDTFDYWCKVLKVDRLAFIKSTLQELKGLFTISELEHNTIQFSLNTLTKAVLTGTDKLFNFTQEQLSKVKRLIDEVNDKNLDFKEKQVKEITEALKDNTMKFNKKVIKELCRNSRKHIKNILGYTQNIATRLRAEQV